MLWRTSLIVLMFVLGEVIGEEAVNGENIEADASGGVSRILAGWDAYPGQHPHHAALRGFRADGLVILCGGAVVSRQWILTSAACLSRRIGILVRLGVTNLSTPQVLQESLEWFRHPTFNEQNTAVQANDIGLLKLEHPVVYTDLLQRINIQSSADGLRNYDREVMQFTGHGVLWTDGDLADDLQWVYLRAISNTKCRTHFNTLVNDNHICAQWYNVTTQSACSGDFGGPLVHTGPDGVPTVVGVYSFRAVRGCHLGFPGGFTRPGPYHSWLTQVTGIDFNNFVEYDVTTTSPPPEVTTVVTTTEPELDSTTIPPTTTEEPEKNTTTTTTTTPPPATEESGEDNAITTPAPSESSESDEWDSDEDSDDSSDSESDERPGVVAKKKKIEMKVNFNVKIKKEFKVKKMHYKKKHPARARLHRV